LSGGRNLYVQYGAGVAGPPEWMNFDASPTLRVERLALIGRLIKKNDVRFSEHVRFGDIVKGLPVAADSVQGLYASHVLEHLTLADCLTALSNSYRILRPGGVFRMIVPDLCARAERYLACNGSEQGAHWFMRSSGLGRERREAGVVGRLAQVFGNSAHLWMWDQVSLTAALARTGFVRIRRCEFGDAEDSMFRLVERRDRFYDGDLRELALEARKI
jgi:SAM-dependent methyltransferase